MPGFIELNRHETEPLMQDAIHKAAALVEAHGYIRAFAGKTIVVKVGGSIMDEPETLANLVQDVCFMHAVGMRPVVVHGGGKAITKALADSGVETRFEQGYRVTTPESVEVVEQVLSHQVNPGVVEMINQLGGKARGFSGTEIFRCEPFRPLGQAGEPIDIGLVGEVTEVNTAPLLECIEQDVTPVIRPTATGADGPLSN